MPIAPILATTPAAAILNQINAGFPGAISLPANLTALKNLNSNVATLASTGTGAVFSSFVNAFNSTFTSLTAAITAGTLTTAGPSIASALLVSAAHVACAYDADQIVAAFKASGCPVDPGLVTEFQKLYAAAGFTPALPVTGVFDAATVAALNTVIEDTSTTACTATGAAPPGGTSSGGSTTTTTTTPGSTTTTSATTASPASTAVVATIGVAAVASIGLLLYKMRTSAPSLPIRKRR